MNPQRVLQTVLICKFNPALLEKNKSSRKIIWEARIAEVIWLQKDGLQAKNS